MHGTIKNTIPDRQFGFIIGDDGKEYFFHISGLKDNTQFGELQKGLEVEFIVVKSNKGPRAEGVEVVNG